MPKISDKSERLIVGCMTGTSLDGLDVALVRVTGNGLKLRWGFEGALSRDFGTLRELLRTIADGAPTRAADYTRAATELAKLHADAILELLNGQKAELIVVHGQTVFHAPPLSTQLLQPAPIARRLWTPVLYDLRAADLAAGGQGAPITPLADFVLFSAESRRAIVNLGGFANYTLLPSRSQDAGDAAMLLHIEGGDICACNHILDQIARQRLGTAFDNDGAAAANGIVNETVLAVLEATLGNQFAAKKSLGSGDELMDVVREYAEVSGEDLARTACVAIARTIARQLSDVDEIIVAGGATKNATLIHELSLAGGGQVRISDALGVPSAFREAIAMAILGALSADGVPITLPQITGCGKPAPLAGAWVYPPD